MTCPLTLGDRMTFLPLTETNPFNSLGYVKVSLQTDAPKCKSIIIKGEGTDNNQTQNKLVKNITAESSKFSRLNLKNKIRAINTLALSVLVYSFRIFNWVRKEIEKMDRKMRKLVTAEEINYKKAYINRLYIKRWNGGAG